MSKLVLKSRTFAQEPACHIRGCKNSSKFSRNVTWHCFTKEGRSRYVRARRVPFVGTLGKLWCTKNFLWICDTHVLSLPGESTASECAQFDERSLRFEATTGQVFEGEVVVGQEPSHDNFLDNCDTAASLNATESQSTCETDIGDSAEKSSLHITWHSYALRESETIKIVRETLDEAIIANRALETKTLTLEDDVVRLKEQLLDLQQKYNKLQENVASTQKENRKESFSLESVIEDDDKIRFYTGFDDKVRLNRFLSFMIETYRSSSATTDLVCPDLLSLRDGLFLVLCRLRLGLRSLDLAHRFGVTVATVDSCWSFWIHLIGAQSKESSEMP